MRCSTSRSPSISRAASTRCGKPPDDCATADGSSIYRPAWSEPDWIPTAYMPPPNRRWETMTAILSKELRGRNITVNAVAPGPTSTELFLNGKSPELIERMAKMNPLERLGMPDDIAGVIAFLVGPDGGWINGQVLRANGGM